MKTDEVKKTIDSIKDLQLEVGSWERRKEISKAEVESLERRRKEIFAEHDVHKQASVAEAEKRIAESKKLQEKVDQARNDLAEAQAKFQAERQDLAVEKAEFNSERNALDEKVKQATERLIRIQNFLKAVDLARAGL